MADIETRSRDLHVGALGQPDALAGLLSTFARDVAEQDSPHATLVEIVRAAIQLVPGCQDASISLVQGRHKVSPEAASSELPRRIDALQEQYQEGPCLDAAFLQVTVRVDDLATDARWPRFADGAIAAGVGSLLCFQLFVEGDNLGSMNLMSRRAGAFTDESEHVGHMLAAHAAVAYSSVKQNARLTRSARTQQLVGQAQGILMERHKITDTQAFAVLVRASQSANVKVRDLAAELVRSGQLGTPEGASPSADPAE